MLRTVRVGAGRSVTDDHAIANLDHTMRVCCDFLRMDYAKLRDRVLQGGSDEEILEWCFENGRRLNSGDLLVWNGFVSKLGWRDFASGTLDELKQKHGIADRTDIMAIADLIDFDEGRLS